MQFRFSFKRFQPTDLKRVMYVNSRCLPENYTSTFYMDLYKKFPATFITAEDNGEVFGYIMCRIERGLSNFKLLSIIKKGHVISFAILPERRRQGVGSVLLRKAMQSMLLYEAAECYLEVRVSNNPAINLYRKLGFTIVQTNQGYYVDGEGAYTMARKIPFSN